MAAEDAGASFLVVNLVLLAFAILLIGLSRSVPVLAVARGLSGVLAGALVGRWDAALMNKPLGYHDDESDDDMDMMDGIDGREGRLYDKGFSLTDYNHDTLYDYDDDDYDDDDYDYYHHHYF